MPRWVDYIPGIHKKILAQKFGPNDSQIVSAIADPEEAINRGAEWFRHNASVAGGGDPYDNPNPLLSPTRQEYSEAGTNLAGLAQVGNMPGAPISAGGTLGTFIGPKAATWDAEKAALAKQLLDAGADPKQVWKHLTIGKMPGGHLFSEIDDSAATIIPFRKDILSHKPYEVINHDELLDNYPELTNLGISKGQRTYYNSDLDHIKIGNTTKIEEKNPTWDRKDISVFDLADRLEKKGMLTDERDRKLVGLLEGRQEQYKNIPGEVKEYADKSYLLHELQHAIQKQENWPTGGSPNNTPLYDPDKVFEIRQHRKALGIDPEQVRGMIESGQPVPLSIRERLNKFDDLLRQEKEIIDNKLTPIEAYRRLQGEAQARLTQDRIPLTMEQRREQYPLEGNKIADIPFNKLITQYGGGGDQRSIINQMAKGGKK